MDIDIASKLFPNITTVVVQLLSTGVMLLIFKKFLWVPMQEYFAKRADFIEGTIQDAKDMQEQAKAFVEASETQSKQAAMEYRSIVEQAKEDAKQAKETILEDAASEARQKIELAGREIENQKAKAASEMKEEIVLVAMDVASKVMNQQMDDSTNKALIESFVEEVVN
ncbi:F0F1 ATP synthase subunit B [Tannockella kyphosi]|uniref:F0F1 ATP synthase subunit B n=1 Tax=Tannockella kyphosi TaxID=2899121 RepID=UPI002010F6BF|nr:F0F1 ATP synthase subunit B [Tannockella kyphosi]